MSSRSVIEKMVERFFAVLRGVKLCVYHLGMFTESVPRDKIETTGAVPANQHVISILLLYKDSQILYLSHAEIIIMFFNLG